MAWSDATRPTIRLAAMMLCGLSAAGGAAVVTADAAGMEVRETATIAAPPARVWSVLVTPADWWDAAHTFGGDAAALTLDARPGGCFCERLAGGGVEHLRVIHAAPGRLLRMSGALGPFQGDAVAGAMTIELRAAAAGTAVVLTYRLAGRRDGGFAPIAAAVDGVPSGQLTRLKAAAEARR